MSKVDRYIVYHDGSPKTVWAWKADAVKSAVSLIRSGLTNIEVIKHPKRGAPFVVAR